MNGAGTQTAKEPAKELKPKPELLVVRKYDPESFQTFHQAHDKRAFAPDFISRLMASCLDPDEYIHERVFSWVLLMANGNFSDYPIDAAGNELLQGDCAEALGIDFRRVSEAVQYLCLRNRLRKVGQRLYYVDDPNAQNGRPASESSGEYRKAFALFSPIWASEHPELTEKRIETRAAREELKVVLDEIAAQERADFKRWLKAQKPSKKNPQTPPENGSGNSVSESGTPRKEDPQTPGLPGGKLRHSPEESSATPRTKSAPSLVESLNSLEGETRESSSSLSQSKTTTTNTPLPKDARPRNPITEALAAYGMVETEMNDRLVNACRKRTPDCSEEEIVHFIHVKGSLAKENPVGFLLVAVPKCFDADFRSRLPDVLLKSPTEGKKKTHDPLAHLRSLAAGRGGTL